MLLYPGIKVTLVEFFQSENNKIVSYGYICLFVLIFLLLILEYSWINVIYMDPGSLSNEIIHRGEEAVLKYPKCPKCNLPKPPRCHHCSQCGCILFMDHHCDAIGRCLGYRNFKVFILVLFYGSLTCLYGAFVIFTALFLTNGKKATQTMLILILLLFSFALRTFSNIYIQLSDDNTSTIDKLFPMEQKEETNYPKINYFDHGIMMYLPTPPHINPFDFLE